MHERLALSKIEDALRSLGLNARFGYRPADALIPRETFSVAIECDGVPFGEVRDSGATLDAAWHKAIIRWEDASGQRWAA